MTEAYEVVPHSTRPDAIEATRSTFAMLGGRLVEQDGRFYVIGPPFVRFAAAHQGYVRSVSETPTQIETP
jgi:hypothetical protein